ncbi:Protein of unknown function [Pseudomonas pohangensis]|uniref:Outer membrane lipoprotein-sorting protein n=2 Tax=Pseudomonas pohangensis TaxID=364197 RepID=A0A1H2HUW5_9PSED|nr:Protein of unknown function [Pseudomonas pohangensis]
MANKFNKCRQPETVGHAPARQMLAAAVMLLASGFAQAAVTPEQAAQLGTTLTPIGAEMAGNAAGTIPPYTGGLPQDLTPPGYTPGDSMLPDPFAGEKPLLVITGQNRDQYKDQLTAVTYELLRRYPSYRVDVYPTHRSVPLAEHQIKNARINATNARTGEGGLALENAVPGVAFPIPQTGYEAMWNHLFGVPGLLDHEFNTRYESWNMASDGTPILATSGEVWGGSPLATTENINKVVGPSDVYGRIKVKYNEPARRAGEAIMGQDAVNPLVQPRRAWQYLPGQRRVKLAPDIAYDTPNPGTAGSSTYDDVGIFNGAMDRFDFKLIGKKEMIIPYNNYKLNYEKEPAKYVTANHLNPDFLRWELHRVWVVEATLKPGKRHIYKTRTFYLDEDSWRAVASDEYDGNDELYRGGFAHGSVDWYNRTGAANSVIYDLIAGRYNVSGIFGPFGGIKLIKPLSKAQWSPQSLAGAGIR